MDPDQLFLETLDELYQRLRPREDVYGGLYRDYDVLMVAALLRKLLLDSQALMDVVNRGRRLKIRFRVHDSKPTSREWWAIMDELDPETATNTLGHWYVGYSAVALNPTASNRPVIIDVPKADLLRRPVVVCKNHQFTVANLILHMAHEEGAVHIGTQVSARQSAPETERVTLLRQFVRESRVVTVKGTGTGEEMVTFAIRIPGSESAVVNPLRLRARASTARSSATCPPRYGYSWLLGAWCGMGCSH
jgi:hypothetical protein